jgi:fructose/tagatose bisphosphate aldolase
MRILGAAQLKRCLDATCVYNDKGKLKPDEQRHGLLALNVYSDAWLVAAMAASAKLKSPVILESSPRVFGQWGSGKISYFMIDAGSLPLAENIALTRRVVEMGRDNDVLVEGEFSVIGGVEDGQAFHAAAEIPIEDHAQGIAHFVEQTGVDVIAYDFGTLHGAKSDQKQTLNVELLHHVNELLHRKGMWRPTTGHGGTSVSDADAHDQRGYVSKLNKATIGKVYDVAGPLADMCESFIRLIAAENRA